MADLTGSTIASSYDQLLALPSGGGDGSTLVALTDGNAGNTFALQVSTAGIKSTGTLEVAGITTATGGVVGDLTGNVTATSVLADGVTATTQAFNDSSTKVATTAYVDTQAARADTLTEVLSNGNTTGSYRIIVSAGERITTDTISETTAAAGVTIDSVLVKDNTVTATTFTGALTGNASGTAATVTGATQAAITTCANLTTVGTIGTGVWQGTAVDGTYIDLEGTELKSTGETGGTKYLREDGDGTCSWQAATATLTIDSTSIGSSTAGSVLFVNSSNQLSQENDQLFWDQSNNRLGVGTNAPSRNFEVGSTGQTDVVISSANDQSAQLNFGDPQDDNIGRIAYNHSTNQMAFRTNAVDDRVVISSAGLVGVGTASPSSYNSNTNNFVIRDSGSGGMTISTGASNSGYYAFNNGEDTTLEGLIEYNHSTDAMSFRTNSVDDRVVIDSSGNVGIGGSPTGLLHLTKATDPSLMLTNSTGNQSYYIAVDDSETDKPLVIGNGTTVGTNPRITLNPSTGNVGIGTTSPTSNVGFTDPILNIDGSSPALAIKGTAGQEGSVGTQNGLFIDSVGHSTAANNIIAFRNNDSVSSYSVTERMRIDSSGKVGIGVSPSKTLHVKNTTGIAQLRLDYNGSYSDIYADSNIYMQPNGTTCIGFKNGGNTDFYNASGAVKMTWDATNERLGIGTASPGRLLELSASTSGVGIKLNNTGTSGKAHSIFSTSDGSSAGNGALAFYDDTAGAFRMAIDTSGNVGVGLVAPKTKLTVEGAVTLKEQAAADSDTAAYGQIWVKTGTPNTLYFTDDAGTDVQLGTGGSSGVTTTTTSSSGGAASYAVDFNGDKFQKVIGDASLTDLTFTSSNRAAGRTVTLLVDVTTNSPFMNSVAAPSWIYFGEDLNSYVPSSGYFIVKLTSWGTTDAAVTADVINSVS